MNFISPFKHPSVMVFKGAIDSQENLYKFASFFGNPTDFYTDNRHYSKEKPWLFCLANESAKQYVGEGISNPGIGGYWHNDYGFRLDLPKYTMIRCVMIPSEGGQTLFADTISAYEDLPINIKMRLENLWAIRDSGGLSDKNVAHKLVMLHPIFNKKHLFFSYRHLNRFLNSRNEILDSDRDIELANYLKEHVTQEKYIFTHTWEPNDLVIWDNRCVMHRVNHHNFDNSLQPRWLERIVIKGDIVGKIVD